VIKGGSQLPPFFISASRNSPHSPQHDSQNNQKEIAMSDSQQDVSTPELIEQVIGSGLFSFDDEPHFTWQGCEHCADGLGATVYDLI